MDIWSSLSRDIRSSLTHIPTLTIAITLITKRIAIFLCHIFKREDGRDCGGVSTPGHGQGEGPARYEFRDSGTK